MGPHVLTVVCAAWVVRETPGSGRLDSLRPDSRAMFTLRNLGSEEAVLALVAGLGDESALFRHEIGEMLFLTCSEPTSPRSTRITLVQPPPSAYVLGQIQHPSSVPGLRVCLENEGENYMVRHECAEALGAIATEEVCGERWMHDCLCSGEPLRFLLTLLF